ncbi:MAG: 1-acyl-sn-glycerol-3-phosphate acyltransferase [Bacteroidota bacterium]
MTRLALIVFYRNRVFTGFDNVPAKGPVIFACNHPNSFLDAMILGAFLKRETYFLARSDVFNTPLKLWILSQLKMMPIYRLSEGKEDLGKNKDTFDKCHEVFRKGGAVLMFSEGLCIQEMRLRPLKKGTARIALEYSKDGAPLSIIATGLNYMKPTQFREDILIQMDKPFNAADFAAEYNENQGKGIQSFNKKLLEGLQNSVIDIHDRPNEKAIEQLVEIEYNNGADLKKLIDVVKPTYSPETLTALREYRAALETNKLSDEIVAGKKTPALLAIPATFVFGLAFWMYLVPLAPALSIVNKKIKLVEFKDSVLVGAAVIFTLLFWVIIFITVGITISYSIAAALILSFIFFGLLAGPSYEVMRTVRNQSNPNKSKLETLRASVLNLVKSH